MINLTFPDFLIIILYFISLLSIGFIYSKKSNQNIKEYLLAGRSLTLPIFVASFVSTWYGGVLGVGEMTFRYGISNWVMQGLPYYFFGAIFALTMAKKVRSTNLFTIPDKLNESYGKKAAIFGAFLTFILVSPAPYILMIAVFLQLLFGWNLILSLVISTIISISYLFWGGFKSNIYIDFFNFFIMFIGFSLILPFAYYSFGGINFLTSNLPQNHFSITGGNSVQYVLVWFFIALWTIVDPTFHQRCYAAKNEKVAQKGILYSIIFWFIFDFFTTTTGLYARAILPDLKDPLFAYPMLAEKILPSFFKGLFFTGIFATVISALSSYSFLSSQTLGKDLYARMKNEKDENKIKFFIRISLIISSIISIFECFYIPSVINLWYTIGTLVIPALLIPIIVSYYKKFIILPNQALIIMISGWSISLLGLLYGIANISNGIPRYFMNIEPMYLGLFSTALLFLIFRSGKKPIL